LRFVAVYVFFDSIQLILAGALRGAGDTWFVLGSAIVASAVAITIGLVGLDTAVERLGITVLSWWWSIITLWVWLLAVVMIARYRGGRWQMMRMI
jgi:MATE family multidrug resistance protein